MGEAMTYELEDGTIAKYLKADITDNETGMNVKILQHDEPENYFLEITDFGNTDNKTAVFDEITKEDIIGLMKCLQHTLDMINSGEYEK